MPRFVAKNDRNIGLSSFTHGILAAKNTAHRSLLRISDLVFFGFSLFQEKILELCLRERPLQFELGILIVPFRLQMLLEL